MTERGDPLQLPVLKLIVRKESVFVFSAKPKTTPWNWLTLFSVLCLTVSSVSSPWLRHDGVHLAQAVSLLGLLAFGLIYLVMRRSHRTASIDFASGTITVTEALGAERETRWQGELTDISGCEARKEVGVVTLRWGDPSSIPETLCFSVSADLEAFLDHYASMKLTSS